MTQQPAIPVRIAPQQNHWADHMVSSGNISHDTSVKEVRGNRVRYHDRWVATIMIGGVRYRHRSKSRLDCKKWLLSVIAGRIRPTDNQADWWRMEQRKDEEARVDEIIITEAEEAVLLADYHENGDLTAINRYIEQRLSPHMAYYCAHTLHMGQKKTVTASRQAIALLLTRITAGVVVRGMTDTCKRMLRLYKERGDFFYYENAPAPVRLVCNRIDFGEIAKVWKVTKDKRLTNG